MEIEIQILRRLIMTLVQLKYAVCAAGEASLNDASKKLYISQPSLSNAIKGLEKEIGIEIFNKSKTGISLTVEGKNLSDTRDRY